MKVPERGMPEDGVMVLTLTELRWIKEAVRRQLDREKRLLQFLENTYRLADDRELHQSRVEMQKTTVEGYRQLLRKVVRQGG